MEADRLFIEISVLIGEQARALMLWNLLDGRALTSGELAMAADISAQAASNHLKKLVAADILKVEKRGKHRYYRFSREEVAYAVEALAGAIPAKKISPYENVENGDIRYARTCYDHLAGKIAVLLFQSLNRKGIVCREKEAMIITPKGEKWLSKIGIHAEELRQQKRALARPCLDWTERKYHLAGALGASLLKRFLELDWIRKKKLSRGVILTPKGRMALYELYK